MGSGIAGNYTSANSLNGFYPYLWRSKSSNFSNVFYVGRQFSGRIRGGVSLSYAFEWIYSQRLLYDSAFSRLVGYERLNTVGRAFRGSVFSRLLLGKQEVNANRFVFFLEGSLHYDRRYEEPLPPSVLYAEAIQEAPYRVHGAGLDFFVGGLFSLNDRWSLFFTKTAFSSTFYLYSTVSGRPSLIFDVSLFSFIPTRGLVIGIEMKWLKGS